MTVEEFLDHAELRLSQAGYAEAFAAAINDGASKVDALRAADTALPAISDRVGALFSVLRKIAAEMPR